MNFIIERAAHNQWHFRVVAANGKTLCHSETYTRKRNALEAVALIQNGAADAHVEERV